MTMTDNVERNMSFYIVFHVVLAKIYIALMAITLLKEMAKKSLVITHHIIITHSLQLQLLLDY